MYLAPDPSALKATNLEAHEAFRQMNFYSGELMAKYAGLYREQWDDFVSRPGHKSEASFVDFLVSAQNMPRSQAKTELQSALFDQVLSDPDNRLKPFISERNRTKSQPLTHNLIKGSLFKNFLSGMPSQVEFESETDFREIELANMVRLMSIIAEEVLIDRWNPNHEDAQHKKAERICSSGSIRAWTKLLGDLVFNHLHLYEISTDERSRVLYRPISDDAFESFRKFVATTFRHSLWESPDPENLAAFTTNNDSAVQVLFQNYNLTPTWVTSNVTH